MNERHEKRALESSKDMELAGVLFIKGVMPIMQ